MTKTGHGATNVAVGTKLMMVEPHLRCLFKIACPGLVGAFERKQLLRTVSKKNQKVATLLLVSIRQDVNHSCNYLHLSKKLSKVKISCIIVYF